MKLTLFSDVSEETEDANKDAAKGKKKEKKKKKRKKSSPSPESSNTYAAVLTPPGKHLVTDTIR